MPHFSASWLIFARELRDQLRDRRTLFTVLVLPLLIYPLLSIGLMQVAQFAAPPSSRVWIVGAQNAPPDVPLVANGRLSDGLLSPEESSLIIVEQQSELDAKIYALLQRDANSKWALTKESQTMLQEQMRQRRLDAIAILPPDLARRQTTNPHPSNGVVLVVNSSESASILSGQRIQRALAEWNRRILISRLQQLNVEPSTLTPSALTIEDVGQRKRSMGIQWSRIFPLIMVIWALTGAFYPAVDLCAGEKERGTLETLLSSPASRIDIILGKLLTVMSFSMATAILNLISIQLCGSMVLGSLSRMGSVAAEQASGFPPLSLYPMLILALIPISALFSALALSVAAFARSSKEGQYYLMPLIMVSLPLMMIAMLPGARLGLGNSVIPLSGLLLLLQAMIEGDWLAVGQYFLPTFLVTVGCGWFAVGWCLRLFNDETILFRTGDRISWRRLLHRWMRERNENSCVKFALACFTVILIARFFSSFIFPPPHDWNAFWLQTVGVLIVAVAGPAILMACLLTRNPLRSLRLGPPPPWTIALAGLLAFMFHPTILWLSRFVMWLYPPASSLAQTESILGEIFSGAPGLWAVLLVIAFAPAVCEEIAFRGFILSGLRSRLDNWSSLFITSLMFGFAHTILQQSIITFFVGFILGVIAIRAGSIWPCVTYHLIHNSLSVLLSKIDTSAVESSRWLSSLLTIESGAVTGYQPIAAAWSAVFGCLLLGILLRNSHGPLGRQSCASSALPAPISS